MEHSGKEKPLVEGGLARTVPMSTTLSEVDTKPENTAVPAPLPPLVEESEGQITSDHGEEPSEGGTDTVAEPLLTKEETPAALNTDRRPMETETRGVGILWGPGVFLLTLALLLGGLLRYLQPPPMVKPGEPGTPPITALRVTLPDGRQIAYREQGASAKDARHSLLVIHGMYSSRLAGIPGVSEELLREFKVRLVAYDRPGYGQSDPQPNRTLESSARDMEALADALGLGPRFWVLGYSGGGPHAWAAAKFIPARLAGVAMFAPIGNPYWPNMTREESAGFRDLPLATKLLDWTIPRYAPFLAPTIVHKVVVPAVNRSLANLVKQVGEKDKVLLDIPEFSAELHRDVREALRQGHGLPVAQERVLATHSWGFDLPELQDTSSHASLTSTVKRLVQRKPREQAPFAGPIHIWQGTDDALVPVGMALYAKRTVPRVHLHLLDREGHFSWFCWCDSCHREVLDTLFGPKAARY